MCLKKKYPFKLYAVIKLNVGYVLSKPKVTEQQSVSHRKVRVSPHDLIKWQLVHFYMAPLTKAFTEIEHITFTNSDTHF